MDSKMSDRLQKMVRLSPAKSAPVKVRLRPGLSEKKLSAVVRKIESEIPGAEYLSISGTVHGTLPLEAAGKVSKLPEVESIDVEQEVPIEKLIDPK